MDKSKEFALARALVTRPKILILDDTTSAVDIETEKIIKSNLDNLDFECTKFVITQRTTFSINADKIIMMKDGRIVEQGTHNELMNKKGYYYEIYCVQNNIN